MYARTASNACVSRHAYGKVAGERRRVINAADVMRGSDDRQGPFQPSRSVEPGPGTPEPHRNVPLSVRSHGIRKLFGLPGN